MKYAILLIFCALFACKDKPEQGGELMPPPASASQTALPKGFTEFYQRFHADSLYQVEHIVFPLEGLPDDADSLTLAADNFRWQADDWRIQRAFDFEMSEFRRELMPVNEIMVVEKIVHTSGEMGMVRRFAIVGGEWHLIYYAGMNRLKK